jgi:hypothetical protein
MVCILILGARTSSHDSLQRALRADTFQLSWVFRIFFRLNSASKVYQVKEIAKETNPSVNNKLQAIEIRKGNNSLLKINKKIKY